MILANTNLGRALGVSMAAAAWCVIATAAHADLRVSFQEGAPKDRFEIRNIGACTITGASVVIDLSQSQGGLIFDVTSSGQGTQVFQPFEIVQGAEALARVPTVVDGQNRVALEITRLAPDASIAFTIDVDDTLGQRATTVTGAEIAGATVSYNSGAIPVLATFANGPRTVIPIPDC